MFGNGQSTSRSNTPEPLHGPRFPVATIRDNVHRLRVDSLHVTHVRAVIGFSMGAEQARYEARFIPTVTLAPIPSLWGHPAGAGASPANKAFLNERIAAFLR